MGKGWRAVLRGVALTWQTEQICGTGRSRAKNCVRWQSRQDACSGYSVMSGKASDFGRTSCQFFEGNLWHESQDFRCSWVACEKLL